MLETSLQTRVFVVWITDCQPHPTSYCRWPSYEYEPPCMPITTVRSQLYRAYVLSTICSRLLKIASSFSGVRPKQACLLACFQRALYGENKTTSTAPIHRTELVSVSAHVERPHHVSSLTLNNSQQPANFASCRASDTLTRSFARYKFVAYLLTYLLTYKNSIFFALVFSGMRSIDSSSVKHSYLVELGWETALQALGVRNFTQP